jgi:protoporphyrinogen oxidase
MDTFTYGVIGGGIAGISFAHFLKNKDVIIFEKSKELGGLCRSFQYKNVSYDIGPHILFSKDKEILDYSIKLLGKNIQQFRRSNKIFYKGKFVKYPFENDLFNIPKNEREYCLNTFLHNPYSQMKANNMLQFFLKTFGEGITNLYLRPYNEKIWKFDPSYMDTQMVERIPKPPPEDSIKSAQGISTEGYVHQLNFFYPKSGGIQSLVTAYHETIKEKVTIHTDEEIKLIEKKGNYWILTTSNKKQFRVKNLISTIPIFNLLTTIKSVPEKIISKRKELFYNSIIVVLAVFNKDNLGDNFAFYVPEKDIIFHRLSKLNFFGKQYSYKNKSSIMVEITHRPDDLISATSDDDLKKRVIGDLVKIGFVKKKDFFDIQINRIPFAYVIYDLNHRQNINYILKYLKSKKVSVLGRFAQFEYHNTDVVIRNAKTLADQYNTGK